MENLNETNITDNEHFWKTIRLFLLKKHFFLPKKISLIEGENNSLLTNCEEVAKELNNFFAIAVKNLNIRNYEDCYSLAENIDDLKAIAKWRNHPIILATASEYKSRRIFSYNFVYKEDVLTEIKVLNASKAIQESDIPVKIIKANENFFAEAIYLFDQIIENGSKDMFIGLSFFNKTLF